ncbi:hypothetical protein [Confluentibacter flavum]|uniref:Uncharacterized protein n=1 Tax=Confluentibacter flavum TaxID=1909700 RepID=A0A2N3HP84_9FLAO|nr:hypothetical protein [Confluentibacter flavum]PKQ46658.1 hypothetical protein CSW08_01745 [Confluentibacter flavum]
MNDNEIFDQLNNPEFKINIGRLLWEVHKTNLNNGYHLAQILKTQLEIKESLKGNTGQEAESNVEAKFSELNLKFDDYLREDLTDDLNLLSSDD